MAKIRIQKWFIEKAGIEANENDWYEVIGATEKAYKTPIGWIPKKCTNGYDCNEEANILTREYKDKLAKGEKKYRIKEDWIFNLEAMNDKLFLIAEETPEDAYPIEIANYICRNADDVWNIRDWADELHYRAWGNKVTGKEYGEIKKIVYWRVMERYVTCINNGMDEDRAGACFNDL